MSKNIKYNKDGSITKAYGVARKDLTGQLFGELKVIERVEAGPKKSKWLCECTITKRTRAVIQGDLLSGKVDSLPTSRSMHGMSKEPIYGVWEEMIQRTTNSKHKSYKNYGGRGITVCEDWNNFENFFKDMGHAPKGMTLDRKNNNRGYSKRNCRWLSFKKQQNNKRTNVVVKYNNKRYTLAEFSERFNMDSRRVGEFIGKKLLTPRQTILKLGGHL